MQTTFCLSRSPGGNILLEIDGNLGEITTLIMDAMESDPQVAAWVLAAIPGFLDVTGRSRSSFAKVIIAAPGMRKHPRSKYKP